MQGRGGPLRRALHGQYRTGGSGSPSRRRRDSTLTGPSSGRPEVIVDHHQAEGQRGQDPPPAAPRPGDRPGEPGAPGGPRRPGGQACRFASAWPFRSQPCGSTASTPSTRRSEHEGHDQLLEELGRRLQHAGRAEDTPRPTLSRRARSPRCSPEQRVRPQATAVVGSILSAVGRAHHGRPAQELFLTLSMGVAIYPSDGVSAAEFAAQRRRGHAPGGGRGRRPLAVLPPRASTRSRPGPAGARRRAAPRPRGRPVLPGVPAAWSPRRPRRSSASRRLVRWRHPERGVRAADGLHPRRRGLRRPASPSASGSCARPARRAAPGTGSSASRCAWPST